MQQHYKLLLPGMILALAVLGSSSAGACAGPGSVTVTQTKAFSQSGGISIGP